MVRKNMGKEGKQPAKGENDSKSNAMEASSEILPGRSRNSSYQLRDILERHTSSADRQDANSASASTEPLARLGDLDRKPRSEVQHLNYPPGDYDQRLYADLKVEYGLTDHPSESCSKYDVPTRPDVDKRAHVAYLKMFSLERELNWVIKYILSFFHRHPSSNAFLEEFNEQRRNFLAKEIIAGRKLDLEPSTTIPSYTFSTTEPSTQNLLGIYQAVIYAFPNRSGVPTGLNATRREAVEVCLREDTSVQIPGSFTQPITMILKWELDFLIKRADPERVGLRPTLFALIDRVVENLLKMWRDTLDYLEVIKDGECQEFRGDDDYKWPWSEKESQQSKERIRAMLSKELHGLPWSPQEIEAQVKLLRFLIRLRIPSAERSLMLHLEDDDVLRPIRINTPYRPERIMKSTVAPHTNPKRLVGAYRYPLIPLKLQFSPTPVEFNPGYFRVHRVYSDTVDSPESVPLRIDTRRKRVSVQEIFSKLIRPFELWKASSTSSKRAMSNRPEHCINALDTIRLRLDNHNKLLSESDSSSRHIKFSLGASAQILSRITSEILFCFRSSIVGLENNLVLPEIDRLRYSSLFQSGLHLQDVRRRWDPRTDIPQPAVLNTSYYTARTLINIYKAVKYVQPVEFVSILAPLSHDMSVKTVDKIVELDLEKLYARGIISGIAPAGAQLLRAVLCNLLEMWSDTLFFLNRLQVDIGPSILAGPTMTSVHVRLQKTQVGYMRHVEDIIWDLEGRLLMNQTDAMKFILSKPFKDIPWHPQEVMLSFDTGALDSNQMEIVGSTSEALAVFSSTGQQKH
ncbi:hypothetical protein BJ508DRAFT_307829 [Ascobolus immersus RN42]|uniref:Uncharacterized protein n=1 Tax=Ascobolus immersus RN42 TaxID=1160509 RepID=A0A3N4I1E1_ASCIM|nr:hypothetical protein BJ508DRAFT_307829 [Ascobolus immersus RN42]